MVATPQPIVADEPEVLPALRTLFSRDPACQDRDPRELAAMLGTQEVAITSALEALCVEGEVLA
jgi:hypothetical protein